MTFETKEEILNKIISMSKPNCPYCNTKMNIWEVPSINVGDGLGWGVPFLFMCFNDDCKLYVSGWNNIKSNYAHKASYRCVNFPGTKQFELIPVFSPLGASGQIINEKVIAEEQTLKENIKKGFSILSGCYVSKDEITVLRILMDSFEPIRVRLKAIEMLGDIGSLEVLEPMLSLNLSNSALNKALNKSLKKLCNKFNLKQCPYCSEIIKKSAIYCKHCQKSTE